MRRRDFIKVVAGSAAAWPLGAGAQEPGRIYRVAVVVPVGRDEPAIIAFLDELRSQGFVEGQNLIIVPGFLAKNEQVDTIVPAKYREAHARGLRVFLETGEGPVINKRIELSALHRDGHDPAPPAARDAHARHR